MNITQHFEPERGPSVISPDGLQRYTEALDSYTQIASTLNIAKPSTKFAIDAAWESGNIYFCNYDTGYVKKVQFDKTETASLNLTNPWGLSVIQYSNKMESTITDPPQQDRGIWVSDRGTDSVIKTDNELNIVAEATGLSNVVGLIASNDGGCYIVRQTAGEFIKLSSQGVIQDTFGFAEFSPAITKFSDITMDADGYIWILADDLLYPMQYQAGFILQRFNSISPLGDPDLFSSSSSEDGGEEMHVSAIDVDRNSEHNTPKPITLCANAIDNSSKINDIVLDLFGGSGSTLIACEQLNRKCFMMEIDPIYCDVIIKRWETYTNKKAVKLNGRK